MLVGCGNKPEVKYVPQIKNVAIVPPLLLSQECDVPKRDGNKVVDYIVAERRLHNALIICNMQIKERNEYEANIHKELSQQGKEE